jgi:hypothetical protein
VYVETTKKQLKEMDSKHIREYNRQVNKTHMDSTANGSKLTVDDIKEVYYAVPKMFDLFTSIPKGTYVSVFDLPGLNDAMTKDVYHAYVTKNFYKFDLIIFMVDINSALNTSDEIDILTLVLNGIKQNKSSFDVDTKLLVLINKCDALEESDGVMIPQDEEYREMYDQIQTILETKINEIYPSVDFATTCVSCEDGYIYRMYKRNPETKLDIKYMNKFGSNECGKTIWNRKTEIEKQQEIVKLFKTFDYNDRIGQCGFAEFNKLLNEMFSDHNQIVFLMNHVKYSLNQILNEIVDYPKDADYVTALERIKLYEGCIMSLYKRYDVKRNTSLIKEIADKFLDEYHKKLSAYIDGSYVAKTYYDYTFVDKIKYFLERFVSMFKPNHRVSGILKNVSTTINTFCVDQINDPKMNFGTIIDYGGKLIHNGYDMADTKRLIINRLKNISQVEPFIEHFASVSEHKNCEDWKTAVSEHEVVLITGIDKIVEILSLSKEEKLEFVENIVNDIYSSYYASHLAIVMKKGNKLSFPLPDKFCHLDSFVIRSTNKFYIRYKQLCNKCALAMINSDASQYPAMIDPMNVGLETYFVNALSDVYQNDIVSKNDLIDVFFSRNAQETKTVTDEKDQKVKIITTKNETCVKDIKVKAKKAKIVTPVMIFNEFLDKYFDLSKLDVDGTDESQHESAKIDSEKLRQYRTYLEIRHWEYRRLLDELNEKIQTKKKTQRKTAETKSHGNKIQKTFKPLKMFIQFMDTCFDISKIDDTLSVKDRHAVVKADFDKLCECQKSIEKRYDEYCQHLEELDKKIKNRENDDDEVDEADEGEDESDDDNEPIDPMSQDSDIESDTNHVSDEDDKTSREDLERVLKDVYQTR